MPAQLITGGARSGKSAHAEALALESGLPTVYLATAQPGDAEMQQRIARHRSRRPAAWRTVECGAQLALALRREGRTGHCVIVDCLTLWLASLAPENIAAERDQLVRAIQAAPARVLIVTNELGWGVVPLGESTRAFVDEHGITNQRVAAVCERVTLMVCGVPLVLKAG
jgi:adenosylcobinamide kinase/adenosylcobinamide-phosphate guanylyltransferase